MLKKRLSCGKQGVSYGSKKEVFYRIKIRERLLLLRVIPVNRKMLYYITEGRRIYCVSAFVCLRDFPPVNTSTAYPVFILRLPDQHENKGNCRIGKHGEKCQGCNIDCQFPHGRPIVLAQPEQHKKEDESRDITIGCLQQYIHSVRPFLM